MKVLIIDDEPLVRRSLKRAFQMQGHEVIDAVDGEQGLELWRCEKPDVVFLDVLMPKLTGPQVLRQIGSDRTGRIIMMSAYSGDTKIEANGVDLFISKPFQDIFEITKIAEGLVNQK